ncbi:hypothetical protein K8Q94_03295 [Candidatus Nomurabacteria bacterium]|nr:hypothetical protein [Candidatus Nomurabacteria bacterium]
MNKKNVYKDKDGRDIFQVNTIFNVRIEKTYLHPEYDLTADTNEMTDTGLMIVFKLESKNTTLPSFVGRWDHKQGVLDIDIFKVSRKIVTDFRAGKNNYGGHHPLLISESPRLFAIDINIPKGKIIEGAMTFNIGHGHAPILFN